MLTQTRCSTLTFLPLTAALLAIGCGASSTPNAPEPIVSVETTSVRQQPITNMISAEGVLFPIHQASISPKITAPVRKFYVERGDHVRRGQLLVVLENHDLAAVVVSAEGGYDQAKANYAATTSSTLPEEIQAANFTLHDTKSSLDAEQKLFDSQQKLYGEGAIARKQLDATQVALTSAVSAYKTAQTHLQNLQAAGASQQRRAAKGQLEIASGQYQGATAQLAYTEIRSPIDGVVADRAVYPGDIAPAGTPLLIVMDTSKVVVRLHVPESQAAQLKPGDVATLQVPGFQRTFPAKITVVSPALDPNSTTVEIWVQAANPGGELKPGTSVTVSIAAQTVSSALVISANAILTATDGSTIVMVVRSDNRAYSQTVKTGIRQGPLIQIVGGVHAGEEVIVNGAYGLPDKTRVKATPTASDSAQQVVGP